jgi:DNA-binding SARP family transcriptional activator
VRANNGSGRPDALRAWRRAAGLSQRDLAERSGLSVGAIRDLEQGRTRRPRPVSSRRLASALGVSAREVDAALGGESVGDLDLRSPLQVSVLGPLTVRRHGRVVELGTGQQRAVLGLLALGAGEPVRRSAIIQAIWDAHPPPSAANLVQVYVSRLRRLLEPWRRRGDREGVIASWSAGYQLDAAAVLLDLSAFRRWVRAARSAPDLAAACDRYLDALALWRGDVLADVDVLRDHPAVIGLAQERDAVTIELADAAFATGHIDQAMPHLAALARRDPLHGAAHSRLMLALASRGEQAAALRVFDRISRRMAEELGLDPDPELVSARQRVLRQDVVGEPYPVGTTTARAPSRSPNLAWHPTIRTDSGRCRRQPDAREQQFSR